jgi:hypothetical protein
MQMAPPFSNFMVHNMLVAGAYNANGSAIFILYG